MVMTAPGRAPIDYSVVVIEGGKFRAVGPQSSTPVPKGAEIIQGLGMTIEPGPDGVPIEPGRPADLLMKGATEKRMHAGEWVRYSTPQEEGAEYIAVCLPAFSPETVYRDEE